MLTTLRNHAQSWFIKALLMVIILTFAISFGVGTFTSSKEVLVRLDGEEILLTTFNQQYQEALERLRRQYPDNAEEIAERTNLRRQVFDRIVNRWLMLRAANNLGFAVSDKEVQDAIRAQSTFQVNGQFDYGTYEAILAQNRYTPERFELLMRDDLMLGKYQRGLLIGLTVSDLEVDQRFQMEHEEVSLEYMRLDPRRFGGEITVTDEDIQSYYDSHAAEYMEPARYRVRYLVLGLDHLLERVTLPERAAMRYYERHVEEQFSTPSRVRARHILKRLEPEASEAQKAAARDALIEIRTQVQAGADFAELAREHSEGPTAVNGGDLGYFSPGEMVPSFEEAAFALEPGETSEVVTSPFGLHLIQLTDREEGERKPFEEVQEDIIAQLKEQRAERKLELEAERLPQQILQDGIAPVAQALEQDVVESDWFDGETVLPGLGAVAELYAQVSTLDQGDSGTWQRNPVLGHVFFQIIERQEAQRRPLEEVAAKVRAGLVDEKRRQAAAEAATQALATLANPQNFAQFATEHRLRIEAATLSAQQTNVPGVGFNPDFLRKAFSLRDEAPFAASTNQGVSYLLRLTSRLLPKLDDEAMARQQVRQQLRSEWETYFLQKEYERLMEQAEIEVVAPEFVTGL